MHRGINYIHKSTMYPVLFFSLGTIINKDNIFQLVSDKLFNLGYIISICFILLYLCITIGQTF
jgi:hypothetical protein